MNFIYEINVFSSEKFDGGYEKERRLAFYDEENKKFIDVITGEDIPVIESDVNGSLNFNDAVNDNCLYFVLDDSRKKVSKETALKYLKENTNYKKIDFENDSFTEFKNHDSESKIIERLISDIEYQSFGLYPSEFKLILEYMDDVKDDKKDKYSTIKKLLKAEIASSVRADMYGKEKRKIRADIESLDNINDVIKYINSLKVKGNNSEVNNVKLYSDRVAANKIYELSKKLDNQDLVEFVASLNPLYKALIMIKLDSENMIQYDKKLSARLAIDKFLGNDSKYIYDSIKGVNKREKVKSYN